MSFFAELRRRNVIRVALVYLAGAWLLLQVGDVLFPVLRIPENVMRWMVGLLAVGFPVALVLGWLFEITPDGIRKDEQGHASTAARVGANRRIDRLIISALVVALVVLLFDNYIWDRGSGTAARDGVTGIAVLPMDLLNNDANAEYLADGMTASLISELSKIEALRVISLMSVQRYRKSDRSLPDIANELNVDAIIEGTVLSAGNQIRISASLIPADSISAVWSEQYDKDLGDVLSLHSEIAKAIAQEIRVTLTDADESRLIPPAPVDAAIQKLLLEGRYQLRESKGQRGLDLLEEATLTAPDYAPAWVALAKAYNAWTNEDPGYRRRSDVAANRALELDENLSDAHYVVGANAFYHDWNWPLALKELKRALELNPGNEAAWQALGDYNEILGQFAQSIDLGIRATESNPMNPVMFFNLGWTYNSAGQYQDALASCETGLQLDKQSAWSAHCLVNSYVALGNLAAAREHTALAMTSPEHILQSLMAIEFAEMGDSARVSEIREHLAEIAQVEYVSPFALAFAAFADNDDEAFYRYLEQSVDQKATFTPWVVHMKEFERFNNEARFNEIVKRINLPARQ